MLKLTRKSESGRSMIEMLGVLAVIGVLSVGGIAGYTTAMNSHYANQAADQARRLAAVASAKRLINPSAYLTGSETEGKYTFTMAQDEKDFIKLTVTGLPAAVASRVKGMNWEIAKVDEGETDGSLVFTFKNDLSEISGSSAANCLQRGDCTEDDQEAWDWLVDGEMRYSGYGACRMMGGSEEECLNDSSYQEFGVPYENCRNAGHGGHYCACIQTLNIKETCEKAQATYENCMTTQVREQLKDYCSCIAQNMYENLEDPADCSMY